MNIYQNITQMAALIGDPTRTTILASLADGRSLTAGELAYLAKVSPQTASAHLAKLVEGGLLSVAAQGRHRYYRISDPKVVDVLETMGGLAPPAAVRSLRESQQASNLRFARTCYAHLAGVVGVALTDALVSNGSFMETDNHYVLTGKGEAWLHHFGVTVPGLRRHATAVPRHIDWTERHHHIGGPIAVALTNRLFELEWISRGQIPRSIVLTAVGLQKLYEHFGLEFHTERPYSPGC